jgi:hypothetical protein
MRNFPGQVEGFVTNADIQHKLYESDVGFRPIAPKLCKKGQFRSLLSPIPSTGMRAIFCPPILEIGAGHPEGISGRRSD